VLNLKDNLLWAVVFAIFHGGKVRKYMREMIFIGIRCQITLRPLDVLLISVGPLFLIFYFGKSLLEGRREM
jgi:hypothetical protein